MPALCPTFPVNFAFKNIVKMLPSICIFKTTGMIHLVFARELRFVLLKNNLIA